MARKRLLINWVYYNPVGHAIEGLKLSAGFHKANPGLEIHIALNKRTAYELAKGCPWIKKVYPIDVEELARKEEEATCLVGIPREWNYIVGDYRPEIENNGKKKLWREEQGMVNMLKVIETKFHSAEGLMKYGYPYRLPKGLKYKKVKLKINIPPKALRFAKKYQYNGLKICLIPSGSAGPRFTPTIRSYIEMINEIRKEFPDSRVYMTGVFLHKMGRTRSSAFGGIQIKSLLKGLPNIVNCYDIGFWNQVALLHSCDILIAPHTGFAFIASCVGTPWLVISGGDWPEYMFNHSSFYSVLPKEKGYPYVGKGRYTKHGNNYMFVRNKGQIPPFTVANMRKKNKEIVRAMHLLLNKKFTYAKAMKTYKDNIKRLGLNPKKFHSQDPF